MFDQSPSVIFVTGRPISKFSPARPGPVRSTRSARSARVKRLFFSENMSFSAVLFENVVFGAFSAKIRLN